MGGWNAKRSENVFCEYGGTLEIVVTLMAAVKGIALNKYKYDADYSVALRNIVQM